MFYDRTFILIRNETMNEIKLTRKEKAILSDIIIQTISRCFNGGESEKYKADLVKLNNKILGKKVKK
jgi:nucleoside recognition membrane protein YjiH